MRSWSLGFGQFLSFEGPGSETRVEIPVDANGLYTQFCLNFKPPLRAGADVDFIHQAGSFH